MIIAEKIVETKVEGEYEIIKKHKIEIKYINEKELLEFIEDNCFAEDFESAYYSYGIGGDFDNDVCFIEINKFIEGLEDYDFDEDEEDEQEKKDEFNKWIALLDKYKDYTFNFR
jgi:hypothetical protein